MISDRLTELRRGINTLSEHCVGINSLNSAYEDVEKIEDELHKIKNEINGLVYSFRAEEPNDRDFQKASPRYMPTLRK